MRAEEAPFTRFADTEVSAHQVPWSKVRTKFVRRLKLALIKYSTFLVPMRLGETPVPIPNTTVKTQAADGTALETVWESRWAPDQKKKTVGTVDIDKAGFTSDLRRKEAFFLND